MRHPRSSRKRVRNKTRVIRVVTVRRAVAKNCDVEVMSRLIKMMRIRISLTRPTHEKAMATICGKYSIPLGLAHAAEIWAGMKRGAL